LTPTNSQAIANGITASLTANIGGSGTWCFSNSSAQRTHSGLLHNHKEIYVLDKILRR
jgi:hypothetical protein